MAGVRARAGFRRAGKILGFLICGLVVLVVLLLVLFQFRGVRQGLLEVALARAGSALPGELSVRTTDWPEPGTLVLEGVSWTREGSRLAAAEEISITVGLGALLRRDLLVRRLTVTGLGADLPAIRAAFAKPGEPKASAEPSEAGTPFFPRAGSLPGVPSVAVHDLTITGSDFLLPDSSRVDSVGVGLALEARKGRAFRFELPTLQARASGAVWEIAEARVEAGADGAVRGRSRGRLSEDWPYRFVLDGGADGTFELELSLGDPGRFEEPPGLRATGRVRRDELDLEAVELTAEISVPAVRELARVPGLKPLAAGWPDLEALAASLDAAVTFEPALAAEVELRVAENAWIRRGMLGARYREGALAVDSLEVALPGLGLEASGRFGDEVEASARVEVTGLRWFEPFGPVPAFPESLDLVLEGTAEGPPNAPELKARLRGRIGGSGLEVTGIEAEAWAPALTAEPVAVTLAAEIPEVRMETAFAVSSGEVIEVETSPVRFLPPGARPGAPERARKGTVRFDPASERLEVSGFRVRGVMGNLDVNGMVTGFREGTLSLAAAFAEPPLVLSRFLVPEVIDSLGATWREHGPFTVDARARFGGNEARRTVAVEGEYLLPGPRTLAPLLPEGAVVDTLGPLRGTVHLDLASGTQGTVADVHLDPSATAWIDSSRIHMMVAGDSLVIDRVSLGLFGLALEVNGRRVGEAWDLDGALEVGDATLLQRFVPAFRDSAAMGLRAALALHGTPRSPDVRASLRGFLESRPVTVDSLLGEVVWNEAGLSADLDLPAGLVTGAVVLDSLSASYATGGKEAVPGRLRLEAAGPTLEFFQAIRLEQDPRWRVVGESLAVAIPEGDLRQESPFMLEVHAGGLLLEDLRLAGSLGKVTARAYADPDSSDIRADISVVMPRGLGSASPFPGIWPKTIEARIRSGERGSVSLEAEAAGLELGGIAGVTAVLDVRADTALTRGDFRLVSGEDVLVESSVEVPARFDVFPFAWVPEDGRISGKAVLSGLQLGWDSVVPGSRPGLIVHVDGTAEVGGTLERPTANSELAVRLPGTAGHPGYLLEMDARLRPPGGNAGAGVAGEPGLRADLRLVREEATVVSGRLHLPTLGGGVDDAAGEAGGADRAVDLEIRSEPIVLQELAALLPTDLSLEGRLKFDLAARGPIEDPDVEGNVSVERLEMTQAGGARAAGHGTLRLSGTGRKPVVEGRVEILSGTIPIPEKSKDLLPDEGQATLWEVRGMPPVRADAADTLADGGGAGTPAVQPELDITLAVPSGLWIRGRQMSLELSGDLRIVYRDGSPTVTGRLRTQQGRFTFLGRTFTPERGEVIFYGEDELNPSLDIRLTTRVESYEITVSVTRTALEPEIELSSVPELSQGDIVSVLTFGKPASELNGDQLDLMGQRAAAMAALYGSSELEQAVAEPLGLDMLSYNPSGREGGSSVVVGKYLNRRTLLKYEQALESGAGFLVSLEYTLEFIRNMKVETVVGTRQSGGEISWSRDY